MQELIKNLLIAIDNAGLRQTIYVIINNSALAVGAIFFLMYAKKFKIHWLKGLICATILYYWIAYSASFILWLEAVQRASFPVGILLAPLGCWLIAFIFRVPYKTMGDYLSPLPLILFSIYRIACTVVGCCRGYPVPWGIYNPIVEKYVVPVQLLESLISLTIVGYLLFRAKRMHYEADGLSLPIMMIMYGSARILTEFLHQNAKIILGLSEDALNAAFICVAGVITLLITKYCKPKRFRKNPKRKEPPYETDL